MKHYYLTESTEMENFTSLYPVTTESGDYYDQTCPNYNYNVEYAVTCASNENFYVPPPPLYQQAPSTSSVPWFLSEMTQVQNSILPQENVQPQLELATLDFDINLLQGPSAQCMDYSITSTINYEEVSNPSHLQGEMSSVPPPKYVRRSPRLARKNKAAENILQLPPDDLFLNEVTSINTACPTPEDIQIPSTSGYINPSLLELGSTSSTYYGGLDTTMPTMTPFTMYSSPTHSTTSSSSTSPQYTNLQSSGSIATFQPHQYSPLPTHSTTSSSSTSPQYTNLQSSGSIASFQPQQYSPLPKFSTIKPPPSYSEAQTMLPPTQITKPPPSYPTVEMMLSQRQTTENISPIFSSAETLDDNNQVSLSSSSTAISRQRTDNISSIFPSAETLNDNIHVSLPSSSKESSMLTSPSPPTPIFDQNISNPIIETQSSSSLSKKRDEERVSKRTRTKRLPRVVYEAMSESERSQHNKTLSQQRCVRYRDNKRHSIKSMEKEIDHLEEKRKQLRAKFESLKLTKQKVEQLMPAFLRHC
ncbi:unnamed protein product [Meganyctiphanes norvegica]|uniref:BZIP domain-containing protein n=1 Tax=Meganyctiphanes norvegica TaxID=48144 RepID=A0AAV2SF90_MEGNR